MAEKIKRRESQDYEPSRSVLPFQLGADLATVKAAFQTEQNPQPAPPGLPDVTAVLKAPDIGLIAFFNKDMKVSTILMDRPFHEAIAGVRLGDNEEHLLASIGSPIPRPSQPPNAPVVHLFKLDRDTMLRTDIDEHKRVKLFIIFQRSEYREWQDWLGTGGVLEERTFEQVETQLGEKAAVQWAGFKAMAGPGDRLYFFRTSPKSWEMLCGREGYCLRRGERMVGFINTALN